MGIGFAIGHTTLYNYPLLRQISWYHCFAVYHDNNYLHLHHHQFLTSSFTQSQNLNNISNWIYTTRKLWVIIPFCIVPLLINGKSKSLLCTCVILIIIRYPCFSPTFPLIQYYKKWRTHLWIRNIYGSYIINAPSILKIGIDYLMPKLLLTFKKKKQTNKQKTQKLVIGSQLLAYLGIYIYARMPMFLNYTQLNVSLHWLWYVIFVTPGQILQR